MEVFSINSDDFIRIFNQQFTLKLIELYYKNKISEFSFPVVKYGNFKVYCRDEAFCRHIYDYNNSNRINIPYFYRIEKDTIFYTKGLDDIKIPLNKINNLDDIKNIVNIIASEIEIKAKKAIWTSIYFEIADYIDKINCLKRFCNKNKAEDEANLTEITDKILELKISIDDLINSLNLNTENEPSSLVSFTEKEAIGKIRIGHNSFKKKLKMLDRRCKICGLKNPLLLIGSHIKPWEFSNDTERIDEYNGFLLCPMHDALFDKGFISFNDDGEIIISSKITIEELHLLNIDKNLKIEIHEKNKKYLQYHRKHVFEKFLK